VYKCLGSAIVLLRMAMRALARRDDPISAETLFEELIVNFIMEGGDADTNAAVAGAVLGAYLG
jgi:ADP-ribosylglycohydrolase